jgi:hypothetical protein
MKNLASTFPKLLVLLVLGIGFGATTQAQGSFEGSVSYAIRVTGKDAQVFLENEPPKKLDLHIKEDNYIINLSGGRIARTMLYIGDSNDTYIIDAANRRAFKETYYVDTVKTVPIAVATGKLVDIKGIACKEFMVDKPKTQEKIFYYVNDLYRVDLALYVGKTEAKADFMTKGLEGRIPLRKVIKTPSLTTELDLMSIKKAVHDPENFLVPKGFKLKKRDPRL